MNPDRKARLRAVFALALAFAALACALHLLTPLQTLPSFWYALAANALLFSVAELLVGDAGAQTPAKFTGNFMASSMSRLLLGGLLIFCYLFFVRVQTVAFAAAFFLMYFTNTAFEIKMLLSNLRNK